MANSQKAEILPKVDEWIWGSEVLIWGFSPSHQYTCKVLQPKVGRLGMLSLQYHHNKSESWIQVQGISWALLVINGVISTRIMRPGDIQNIEAGTIHRLMGLTADCRVIEPSTPDAHAADKSVTKDVIRLHCVLGREVSAPRDSTEAAIVSKAIAISDEAIEAVEQGSLPVEVNESVLMGSSGFRMSFV